MSAKIDHERDMVDFYRYVVEQMLRNFATRMEHLKDKKGIYSSYIKDGELYVDPLPNIKPIKLKTRVSDELLKTL